MKIIVDIDNDYFETIKREARWKSFKLYNLITEGVPLNEMLQEIQEELKEEHDYSFSDNDEDARYGIKVAMKLIDQKIKEWNE